MKIGSTKKELTQTVKELDRNLNLVIKDPMLAMETKERLIIVSTSAICGIVAAQPIPFADAFILTPVQLLMVRYLAHLHGLDYKENTLRDILSQIVAVVGWGYLAQQCLAQQGY